MLLERWFAGRCILGEGVREAGLGRVEGEADLDVVPKGPKESGS